VQLEAEVNVILFRIPLDAWQSGTTRSKSAPPTDFDWSGLRRALVPRGTDMKFQRVSEGPLGDVQTANLRVGDS
jgi:hypothetical protein